MITGSVIQFPDRSATAAELRRLADQIETGFVVAFRASMQMNGIGRFEMTTSDEPHPDAPPDVEPLEPTPAETPAAKAAEAELDHKEDPGVDMYLDAEHLKRRP